ncbi:MAG: hypothetical protein VX460_03695 [Planctomycetota bacterium]|nr:hypothetical protein [Planctomycetota bacterium]
MLHFEPTGIFASSFRVTRGAREKTTLSLGWMRESSAFRHNGKRYTLDRTGWISGDFTLRFDGRRLAGAVKTGVLRSSFEIRCPEGSYVLRAPSILRRSYELIEGGRVIGSVDAAGTFICRGRARLPKELSFETSVFVLWLVVLMWRRAKQVRRAAG